MTFNEALGIITPRVTDILKALRAPILAAYLVAALVGMGLAVDLGWNWLLVLGVGVASVVTFELLIVALAVGVQFALAAVVMMRSRVKL